MSFVGRTQELDRLQREVALALELSSGRSLFIQGPAGTGKSTLVSAFLDLVAKDRPGVAIARGRCLQTFGSADPYLPFVDALRDLSDESTAGFVRRETLSELIAELTPYWLSAIPLVGNLLSAGFSTARKLGGGAGGSDTAPSREALFVQYLELIQGLAKQAPLVLYLDDLHWADHSSIALLSHICRGIASQPVLIVGTLRSDDAERDKHPVMGLIRELEREGVGSALVLPDLQGEALGRLLVAEFGGDVSEPLSRWLTETAGGNPLFATELVRLLRQSGAVEQSHGEWHLTGSLESLPVPRSAEAVIESRIQALGPDQVKVLHYASVEGNEFDSVTLAAMLEEDELDVLDRLERLERDYQLIRTVGERELPDGELATILEFRHALVQTVLYRQVLGKRRVLLHRKAAEYLEKLYAEEPGRVAGRLGRHFHLGRVPDRAYRYSVQAAESARRIYAHWEAEEFLRIALDHSPTQTDAARLQERLGDVYQTVGFYAQATAAFQASLELTIDDARSTARLKRKLATVDRWIGSVPANELLQHFRVLLGEAADLPEERCHLLLEIGFLPNSVGVIESAAEAVSIADALEDRTLLAKALEQLAVGLIFGGQVREALPHLARAYETGGGDSDPLRAARYHNILGIARHKLGQYRESLHAFEQMLTISEKLGDSNFIGVACTNIGADLLTLGEYDRAEEILQRAYTIHQRRDRASMVQSLFNLAKRAHWSGDLPLAIERYGQVLEIARELQYWTSEAVAEAARGICYLEQGRLEEARNAAWAAAAVVADREHWFEDREFLEILLAHLEAIDGQPDSGVARLSEAAGSLADSDVFPWAQVEAERIRILETYSPEDARRALANLVEATRGVEFALDGEIDDLVATLKLEEYQTLPPIVS